MDIMTHAKFYFNRPMLTLIFAIWASQPPGPGERLKRPGLIGLKQHFVYSYCANHLALKLRTVFQIRNYNTPLTLREDS